MRGVSKVSSVTTSSTSTSASNSSEVQLTKQQPLTFYPAYCNPASPTWSTWVKLTANDIHHVLRPRAGQASFTDTKDGLVLYYLNHPIQFIQVVGVVLVLEEYPERYILNIDDGSGVTIDATCRKPPPLPATGQSNSESMLKPRSNDDEVDEEERDEIKRLAVLAEIDIGSVVQAKGSVSNFRDMRKINLKRIVVVRDTAAEVLLIQSRIATLENTLSKPWLVSPSEQVSLRREAEGDVQVDKKRAAFYRDREHRRAEREKRHARRVVEEYEREEREREKASELARKEGMRLRKESGEM